MKFKLFGITDVGQVRDHNEDDFAVCRDLSGSEWKFDRGEEISLGDRGAVMVVADGMGGTNAGEIASDLAQKSVRNSFESLDRIPDGEDAIIERMKSFILKAHDEIVAHQEQHLDTAGMGTTLVIAWVLNGKLHVAWSGDSRCYIFNPRQPLVPFTDDHSHVWEMVKQGHLSAEEARVHPESNLILQNLGDASNKPRPEGKTAELSEGDRILVCSDGLNGMLSDERIHYLLLETGDTSEACKRLVQEANRAGGNDNITLVLLDVVAHENGASGSRLVNRYSTRTTAGSRRKPLLFSALFLAAFILLYHFILGPWLITSSDVIHLGTHRGTVDRAQAMILDPGATFLPTGPAITRVAADKDQQHGTIIVSGDKLVYTPKDSSGAFTDQVRVSFYTEDGTAFSSLYELTRTDPLSGTQTVAGEEDSQTLSGEGNGQADGAEQRGEAGQPDLLPQEDATGTGDSTGTEVGEDTLSTSRDTTGSAVQDSTLLPDRFSPDRVRIDSLQSDSSTADTARADTAQADTGGTDSGHPGR